MLEGALIERVDALQPLESQWDELAVDLHRPFCAPAWMLAWWRHLAPPSSLLRVFVVRDGADLIGIVPFYVHIRYGRIAHYRLLASSLSHRVQPLARPEAEHQVAEIVAGLMTEVQPRPDLVSFEALPTTSPWPGLLSRFWPPPRRPALRTQRTMVAPVLGLSQPTYQEWLESKSSNFRQQMGRFRRRLEKQGAAFRLASTEEEIAEGVKSFAALHRARWSSKGGSSLPKDVTAMLAHAAARFASPSRFRLWTLDVGGETVSTQIFIAAGGEVSYWNGGFDERWAAEQPAVQTILRVLEHAWDCGDCRVDFGGGDHPYKYRFASGEDVLEWRVLLPRRGGLAHLSVVQEGVLRAVAQRLPEGTKQRLKSGLHRAGWRAC